MDLAKNFMSIVLILVFLYLLLKDSKASSDVINSLSTATSTQIATLQGNYTPAGGGSGSSAFRFPSILGA